MRILPACLLECIDTRYPDDIIDVVTIDVTDDTNDWQVGDAVYIGIDRDTSITNDFPAAFHLSHVRLTDPTTE